MYLNFKRNIMSFDEAEVNSRAKDLVHYTLLKWALKTKEANFILAPSIDKINLLIDISAIF
jgi:hypothetical protein